MGEKAVLLWAPQQESIACCSCGVTFMMPVALMAERRKDRHLFYCPNGHGMTFTKSTADELLEKLDAAKSTADELLEKLDAAERTLAASRARQQQLEHERDAAERRARAARGEVTKVKNRVGNGVCPCCNRTFQNVMRHMKTKHPGHDFANDAKS